MLSTKTKNDILKCLVGREVQIVGGTVYLGLSSTTPSADGTNITEPTGANGYERALIGTLGQTFTHMFGEPENDTIANKQIIYFPESTDTWGPALTHFVLFSHATSTDPKYVIGYDVLRNTEGEVTPVSVLDPQTVLMFRTGTLTLSFTE